MEITRGNGVLKINFSFQAIPNLIRNSFEILKSVKIRIFSRERKGKPVDNIGKIKITVGNKDQKSHWIIGDGPVSEN